MNRPLRRDALRNRDKLLGAATEVFARTGLDASLEEIARRAGVSIGTLYNHFPAREALFDAIFPERVAALDRLGRTALAAEDAWQGFTGYLAELFATLAADLGLRHVMTREYPDADQLTEACHRSFATIAALVERAQDGGGLREDFTMSDLACLIWAMVRVIDATAAVAPEAWRRQLALMLDGLRAEAARPLDVAAMTTAQVAVALAGPRR